MGFGTYAYYNPISCIELALNCNYTIKLVPQCFFDSTLINIAILGERKPTKSIIFCISDNLYIHDDEVKIQYTIQHRPTSANIQNKTKQQKKLRT